MPVVSSVTTCISTSKWKTDRNTLETSVTKNVLPVSQGCLTPDPHNNIQDCKRLGKAKSVVLYCPRSPCFDQLVHDARGADTFLKRIRGIHNQKLCFRLQLKFF